MKSESGKQEVESFSKRLQVVLAKVFIEGGRLFQRIGAVCWKERSDSLRLDKSGRSSVRQSEQRVELRGLMIMRLYR